MSCIVESSAYVDFPAPDAHAMALNELNGCANAEDVKAPSLDEFHAMSAMERQELKLNMDADGGRHAAEMAEVTGDILKLEALNESLERALASDPLNLDDELASEWESSVYDESSVSFIEDAEDCHLETLTLEENLPQEEVKDASHVGSHGEEKKTMQDAQEPQQVVQPDLKQPEKCDTSCDDPACCECVCSQDEETCTCPECEDKKMDAADAEDIESAAYMKMVGESALAEVICRAMLKRSKPSWMVLQHETNDYSDKVADYPGNAYKHAPSMKRMIPSVCHLVQAMRDNKTKRINKLRLFEARELFEKVDWICKTQDDCHGVEQSTIEESSQWVTRTLRERYGIEPGEFKKRPSALQQALEAGVQKIRSWFSTTKSTSALQQQQKTGSRSQVLDEAAGWMEQCSM